MQFKRLSRLAVFLVGVSAAALFADNTMSPIGTNFWFFGDNQYTWPFVDFFKQSRNFWSSSNSAWDDGRALTLDSNGYPTTLLSGQFAATLLFWAGDAHYPVGDYTLLYDGVGQVTVDFSQGTPITIVSNQPGRIVVTVPAGTQGFRIQIKQTTAGNYVHNIRFIAPGFESTYQTQIFHPLFLQRLADMRCLRFMDWMQANGTKITEWSQRTPVGYQTQGGGPSGVALEYLVELCNRLECDGWFCLPVRGSNDCLTKYATYIRDNLNPCLKAYFEFGNECWNGGVQSNAGYLDSLGQTMGFAAGWTAQHHGWARRMTDMLTIVTGVYAGHMDRCVRVIATQVGNTGVVDGLLNFYNGKAYGDVIAVAPYFNGGGLHGGTDVNLWLDSLAANASRVDQAIHGDLTYANQNNMKIVAYESGLDVWPSSSGITDSLSVQIRFSPRMQTIYDNYYAKWKSGGGTLINQYTFCDPYWGLMKYMDQDTSQAPAYLAAEHFIRANPRWWTETRAAVCSTPVQPGAGTSGIGAKAAPAQVRIGMRNGRTTVSVEGNRSPVHMYAVDGRMVALTADASGRALTPATMSANGCYIVTAGAKNGALVTAKAAVVR
jgi:hypothetical protein